MAVSEFVRADLEFGDMWFEDGVAGHIPIHAGVALAAFFPRNDFGLSNVFHEIRLLPALPNPCVSFEEVRRVVETIVEVVLHVGEQPDTAKGLKRIRERAEHEQSR